MVSQRKIILHMYQWYLDTSINEYENSDVFIFISWRGNTLLNACVE